MLKEGEEVGEKKLIVKMEEREKGDLDIEIYKWKEVLEMGE